MKTNRLKLISYFLVMTLTILMIPVSTYAAEVDLTANGATATVNGAFWENMVPHTDATGTGTFNSFLRVQNSPSERGYNSDLKNPQFDELHSFTDSMLLVNVPVFVIDGISYREFQLDINESDSFISLDRFQVWLTDSPVLSNYDLA